MLQLNRGKDKKYTAAVLKFTFLNFIKLLKIKNLQVVNQTDNYNQVHYQNVH